MPAIMEQTANNAVTTETYPMTFPSLAYDKGTNQITASVIVSPSTDPSVPSFRVPPIAIVGPGPGDRLPVVWTVSWNFVLDRFVTQDTFTIQMPTPTPPDSSPVTVKLGPGVNQLLVTFLTYAVNLTSFSYDIATKNPNAPKPDIEDPTIVVTPDPIT